MSCALINPLRSQGSPTKAQRVLEKIGFIKASQKGSHVKVKNPDGCIAIIPMHKELAIGTLHSILRQDRTSEVAAPGS